MQISSRLKYSSFTATLDELEFLMANSKANLRTSLVDSTKYIFEHSTKQSASSASSASGSVCRFLLEPTIDSGLLGPGKNL